MPDNCAGLTVLDSCPDDRAHDKTSHALAPQHRPHRGTQPQHNAGLQPAEQLAKSTRSHAQHRTATAATKTTATPPARHPSRNIAGTTKTRLRATRRPPVKHPPTKPEFYRTKTHALRPSGRPPPPPNTRRHQRSPRPWSSPTRRADPQPPTQAAKAKQQSANTITTTSTAVRTTQWSVVVRSCEW
jgi:hypothetical protein